jgi:probable selenium-dependent hydroxylase accessory protein YqeC
LCFPLSTGREEFSYGLSMTSTGDNVLAGPIAKAAQEILLVLSIGSKSPMPTPSQARLSETAKFEGPATVPVIAVVGAGGKSTTTFSLAFALAAQGHRVVVSTTTKMGHDQTGGLTPTSPEPLAIARALERPGVCLVVQHPDPASPKVVGPPPAWFDELTCTGLVDAIVIEADGARRRNAKAPGPHEPVLPSSTTHVVALLGADALDRVIEDQGHRPMRIAAAAECGPYDRLTPQRAARLLTSEIGGRKGVRESMGFCAVISKVAPDNLNISQLTADFVTQAGHAIVLVPFDHDAANVVRPTRQINEVGPGNASD